MFPRKFAIVSVVTTVLMLTITPPVESTVDNLQSTEASEEPRHTLTVKPFGPYRLIIPARKRVEPPAPIEPPQPGPQWMDNKYTIQTGDTLSKLVPFLGHSVNELASCSGIANPHRISIGQTLHQPGTCVASPPPPVESPVQPASGVAETVIAFAMGQLGDPYVWGATGPNSWDCSGLVQAAFRHAGISLTRTTKTLIHEGSSVSRTSLVRGDLVFPDSGHVGIYLGDGTMVHAPQSGDVVKISTLWDFYAGRRIL